MNIDSSKKIEETVVTTGRASATGPFHKYDGNYSKSFDQYVPLERHTNKLKLFHSKGVDIFQKQQYQSLLLLEHQLQQDNTSQIISKPKRPLSAYNLFFRNERKLMLGPDFVKKIDGAKPKRRIHRKTHGKISFCEMAKVIAKKWKLLDETTRSQLQQQSKDDKERYRRQMAIWKYQNENLKQKFQQTQQGSWHHPTSATVASKTSMNSGNKITIDYDKINILTSRDQHQILCAQNCLQSQCEKQAIEDEERDVLTKSDEAKLCKLLPAKNNSASTVVMAIAAQRALNRNINATATATIAATNPVSTTTLSPALSAGAGITSATSAAALHLMKVQQQVLTDHFGSQLLHMEQQRRARFLDNDKALRTQSLNKFLYTANSLPWCSGIPSTTHSDQLMYPYIDAMHTSSILGGIGKFSSSRINPPTSKSAFLKSAMLTNQGRALYD